MPCSRLPVVGGLATTLALTALCVLPGTISAQTHEFADWTSVDSGTATRVASRQLISLSGSAVINVPGSTVDGSSTVFSSSLFTPPLAHQRRDRVQRLPGQLLHAPVRGARDRPDPAPLSLRLDARLPGRDQVAPKLSGEDSFTVSGSSVSGALSGSSDASGSVRVSGTFSSIPFSATPVYQPSTEDGILLQVGVALPPAPALAARYTVAPNPDLRRRSRPCSTPAPHRPGRAAPSPITASTTTRRTRSGCRPWCRRCSRPRRRRRRRSASPGATSRAPRAGRGARRPSGCADPRRSPSRSPTQPERAATTATTVEFAQATSVSPREGCPPDDGAPRPRTAPPRFEEDPTVSARDILVAAACLVDPAGCTGDVVAALPSLALEAQRQALISEAKRLDRDRPGRYRRPRAPTSAQGRAPTAPGSDQGDPGHREICLS